MNLTEVVTGQEYIIRRVATEDGELDAFLFSLGCYEDQPITVVSRRWNGHIVAVKDGRYNIDRALARAIQVYD